jgi:hypothetical protein
MVTTNHETVERWVEERGGKPARRRDAEFPEDTLTIAFTQSEGVEAISWKEFFAYFDEHGLGFFYDELNPESATFRIVADGSEEPLEVGQEAD